MTYLTVRIKGLQFASVAPSATFDNYLTELEISGREFFTRYSNIPTPILNCFCRSGVTSGSPSLGRMMSVFGAEVVV
jgi:hypothetical protein